MEPQMAAEGRKQLQMTQIVHPAAATSSRDEVPKAFCWF
jgi:hypothetical protein